MVIGTTTGHGMNLIESLRGLVRLTIGPVAVLGAATCSDDWCWNMQDWWIAEQRSSVAASGSHRTVLQDAAKDEPPQNAAAVKLKSRVHISRSGLFGVQSLDS